jgi:hypothetical protein
LLPLLLAARLVCLLSADPLLADVLGLELLLLLLLLLLLRCSYAADSAGCCTGANLTPALAGLAEQAPPASL